MNASERIRINRQRCRQVGGWGLRLRVVNLSGLPLGAFEYHGFHVVSLCLLSHNVRYVSVCCGCCGIANRFVSDCVSRMCACVRALDERKGCYSAGSESPAVCLLSVCRTCVAAAAANGARMYVDETIFRRMSCLVSDETPVATVPYLPGWCACGCVLSLAAEN